MNTICNDVLSPSDTRLPLVLLTTSNSGCFQMATLSRICRATTPSSTRSQWTPMASWCQEVLMNHQHNLLVEVWASIMPFHPPIADNGTIHLWDWRTGYNFQRIHAAVQPGSLDSESGIFACVFDSSESRLITAEADKTIKVYAEDNMAVSWSITGRVRTSTTSRI